MDHAWEYPVYVQGTLKDILQTMRPLHFARITNFQITERDYQVDPTSGGRVKRET